MFSPLEEIWLKSFPSGEPYTALNDEKLRWSHYDRLSKTPHRGRPPHPSDLGPLSARKVDPLRAYLDAAHVVGSTPTSGL
jgi:hypothetical protein